MSVDVTAEKKSQRDWLGTLPIAFSFVFLFITFLPLSGWMSGAVGVARPWVAYSSILLAAVSSILALLVTCIGGRFLPRLLNGHRVRT